MNESRIMSSALDCYEKIYLKLSEIDKTIQEAKHNKENLSEVYAFKKNNLDVEYKESFLKNSQSLLQVNAYIDIAKSHTSILKEDATATPFDKGALSKLTVLINSSSKNDPYATRLYAEATAQLRFLENEKRELEKSYEAQKKEIEKFCEGAKSVISSHINNMISELSDYLNTSEDVKVLCFMLKADGAIFGNIEGSSFENTRPQNSVSVGLLNMPLPTDDGIISLCAEKFKGFCDVNAKTISIPVEIGVNKGGVLVAEYLNSSEHLVLSGIRNFILNIARYYDDKFDKICFIDPVRFSNNSLGCVAALAEGENSFVDPVPLTMDAIRKRLKNIIDIEVDEEHNYTSEHKKKIYIFHDFPQAYDSEMIAKIQQLCVNAEHYEAIVILTHSLSGKGNISNDILSYIQSMATHIVCTGQDFKMKPLDDEMYNFKWYSEPQKLPEWVFYKLVSNKPTIDKSNDYIKRIGLSEKPQYKKGARRIEHIPYGIDTDGNVLYLDFENTNFATFICGASRSGKSTLLHTIITGVLKNNHPDDIEMWLIDFKMTEFSRYIEHRPPHVRYIVLDESPELVYDIIDRLTEIMQKRQNIFMGKWEKLSKVPPEKYMPAMFIIIDEFSIMSNIVADSIMSSKENYVIKMQNLLAKGAALGMHFIFASQGFTSGTRGLNDFAKKQVQQRIAMKTEFNEIKDTLDLKSTSDGDKALMEQLPVYHALTRIPENEKGNHLKMAYVLYLSDEKAQETMIDNIGTTFEAKPKYDVTDFNAYIDKKTMVINGNLYETYDSKNELITEYLKKSCSDYSDDYTSSMFIGEPQRLLPTYPIEIVNGFCENVLTIAPLNEKASTLSLLLTASKSLALQNYQIECWTTRKNLIFRQIINDCGFRFDDVAVEIEQICQKIRELKTCITEKKEARKMIALLGFETILMDMCYVTPSTEKNVKQGNVSILLNSSFATEKRTESEMDLETYLKQLQNSSFEASYVAKEEKSTSISTNANVTDDPIYDAREDLKYILTHGPRLGYHFIMIYNTVGEFEQSKLSSSLFKHKILFRTAKTDAVKIVSSACAGVVSDLKDHLYRYSNGLDELSFRPYLHNGISIDDWVIQNGNVINTASDEDEYLL